MSDLRSLVIKSGITQNISNSDTLIVGTKVDAASGQALSVGDVNATGITIGSALITTNFPGPVTLTGDVTTVGGTTFTTDATFEGNVTFGAGAADTVTFAALTTVTSDINFGGAPGTYKITNLANGTNPNDAVNYSQLSAIVSGVSAVSATAPLLSSGGATPDISISTVGASSGDVLTYNGAAWAAAAPAATATAQGGANAVQYANATTPANFDGDNAKLAFDEATSQLSVGTGTANETLTVNGRVSIAEGTVPSNTAGYGKLWAESVDKTLHFYDNSIDYLVTPNTVQSISYAASVALDFSPSLPPIKSVTLTGDIAFTSAPGTLGASRNISVRVVGDTVSRNLTSFPAGWKWLGGVTPTVLEANKVAILSLASFSNNDANVVASWSYDGSDVVTDVTASAPLASSGGSTPNISLTGVVGVTNGGTGQSSYVNGELLIGNTTGNTLTKSTLTAGSGVSITNGAGSITIAATGAASSSDVQVSLDTTTNAVAAGDACYASANGVVNEAIADGVVVNTARALGISVGATADKVSVAGLITCNFDTSLSPVLAVGQPVYLSTTSAGKLTNAWPVTSGAVNAEVGIVTAVTTPAGGALAAQVLWQPKPIVVL